MQARFPQDVDLEDRVVLGLTPIRFGYLAVAALCSFSAWSAGWPSTWERGLVGVPPLLAGIALAWGRLRGRPLDGWVGDLAVFATRRMWSREALRDQVPDLNAAADR